MTSLLGKADQQRSAALLQSEEETDAVFPVKTLGGDREPNDERH